MGIAVIGWQIFIFFTIVISGSNRGMVAGLWVIWTLVQVYALPLSVVQFATIFVAYSMARPSKDLQKKQLLDARQKEEQSSQHTYQVSSPDACERIRRERIRVVKGRKVEIVALLNTIKLGKCTLEDRIKLIEIAGGSVRWNDEKDASKGCKVSLNGFDRPFGDLGLLDKWIDCVLSKRILILLEDK